MACAPGWPASPGISCLAARCRWRAAGRWSSTTRLACRECLASATSRAPPPGCPGRPPRRGRSRPGPGRAPRSGGRLPPGRRPIQRRRWRSAFSSVVRVVDHRPHLDDATVSAARPRLGHLERLVEILHIDDRESADDLLGLDERTVGDDRLAVLETHRGRAAGAEQLCPAGDAAGLAVLLEPLVDALIGGHAGGVGHLVPGLLIFDAVGEHEHVLHTGSPCMAVLDAASSTRRMAVHTIDSLRLYLPVNSGSCLARKLMIPIAASSLSAARAKLAASISSASSRGMS